MKSLKKITMFQNGIKEDGMKAIFESLAFNPELELLKINDNLIKNSSADLIAVLPTLKCLQVIDISDSLIGSNFSLEIFKTFLVINIFNKSLYQI